MMKLDELKFFFITSDMNTKYHTQQPKEKNLLSVSSS